jgi:hypothetical protein
MAFDLVIKNGVVIDGSGLPRYRADVGVRDGRIASIGRIRESAREVLDAEGRVVAPGFIDGHTHMDAQIFWDPLGTCSCWHGITSVVMGNCGFTLAPCADKDKQLVRSQLKLTETSIAAKSEKALRYDKYVTLAHRHIRRDIAIPDQIIQSDAELLLLPFYVANDSCLVTRRKIRHTPDLDQNIHQGHFLPIRKCLRFGSLAYNSYLFSVRPDEVCHDYCYDGFLNIFR